MTPREHALWAKALIKECGGLDEAHRALEEAGITTSTSQLSNYQNPNANSFMTVNRVQVLEEYCGVPVISRALFECRPAAVEAISLVEEVSDATEAVAELQRETRLATKDGVLTAPERLRLAKIHRKAADELRDAGDLINREVG